MSSIDFFSDTYKKEEPRTDKLFGISDNGLLAYSTNNLDDCGVLVNNPEARVVQCTPVDHNIVAQQNGDEVSQCDAMLTVEVNKEIDFIELKKTRDSWIPEVVQQLKSTILLFTANHDINQFQEKRAYGINKKHPQFHFSCKDTMKKFRNETKFRLHIGGHIHIK